MTKQFVAIAHDTENVTSHMALVVGTIAECIAAIRDYCEDADLPAPEIEDEGDDTAPLEVQVENDDPSGGATFYILEVGFTG